MSRAILIPAAGLGTRVGQPEAKEMLPRPRNTSCAGQPLISFALDLALMSQARTHVVTRQEKQVLHDYLMDRSAVQKLLVQNVGMTREWPDTLLASKDYWADFNIVVLPDSDFSPPEIVGNMFSLLELGAETAFATFCAADGDYQTWGVVDGLSQPPRHCEKPKHHDETSQNWRAWGIFGFRREAGATLLQQLLESTFDNQWRDIPGKTGFIPLEKFIDLTRGHS